MATTNKRFVAKNGLDNNGQTITNVGAAGTSLSMSGTGDVTIAVSGTATLTVPAGSDTLVTLTGSQTLTNKTISGSNNTLSNIGNGSLTNSSVSFNGVSVALGASGTLYTDDISEDASPTNRYFTDARARGAISVTDSGGDGSLSYDSGTGVITYTGPSASEVRAHFSAGTGVTISSGQVSIGQAVATTDNVTFAGVTADVVRLGVTAAGEIDTSSGNLTIDSTGGTTVMDDDVNVTGNLQIDGNLTVSGTTVTVNATNLNVEDNMIYLNSGSAVANPDLGFAGNYNDGTYRHAGLFRDASDGVFKFFHQYVPEPDASAYIDITHGTFALAPLQASSFTGTLVGAAPAGSLSGSTLASGVTASSLTSVGTLTSLTVSGNTNLATTSGNVGIGTTNPTALLHLRSATPFIYFDDTSTSGTLSRTKIKVGDVGVTQSMTLGFDNTSDSSAVDVLTINELGKVGIGTNAPSETLTVASGGIIAAFRSDNTRAGYLYTDNFATILQSNTANSDPLRLSSLGTSGRIEFYVNSSERVRIDSSGNVGIGTTNPVARLRVFTDSADTQVRIGNNAAYDQFIYFNGTADWAMGIDNSNANAFKISRYSGLGTNDVITISTGSNVGIGTTNPRTALNVAAAATIDTAGADNKWTLRLQDTTSATTSVGGSILFQGYKTTTSAIGNFAGIAGLKENSTGGNENGYLAFYTTPNATGLLNERMRIDSSGNVGINTTGPEARLHVVDTNGQDGTIKLGGSESALGLVISYSQASATTTQITSNPTYTNSSAAMILRVDGDASATANQLYLRGDGLVGIGIASPSTKLTVSANSTDVANGQIRAVGASDSAKMLAMGYHTTDNYGYVTALRAGTGYSPLVLNGEGGNVGIGTTNPGTRLDVAGGGAPLFVNSTNSNGNKLGFLDNGTARSYLGATSTALLTVANSSGTAKATFDTSGNLNIDGVLTEASSIALKENINPITDALSIIKNITGYTYDRKDGTAINQSGFIAEEVANILPGVVSFDKEGNPSGVQYTKIIAYLVESIKELKSELDELKRQ